MPTVDVLVVGAGPSGCMLAAEVARAGRSVAVLDQRTEVSTLSRAFGVHARTLEVLAMRGLADELVATGLRAPGLTLWHGAAVELRHLPTAYPYVLMTPQVNVDRLLERAAQDNGAEVVRGCQVTGLEQDSDGVRVTAAGPDGEQVWRASYVVGADGAHSTVRSLVGQPFPGRSVLRSMVLADVWLDEPPDGGITVNAVRDSLAFLAPFGDGWFRVVAWDRRYQVDDDVPVTESQVRDLLQRSLGTDYGMGEVRWMSRFHCDERQVPSYRSGRAFLVGDAAHVHSPAGGQGMNTGIQDAANLGWKLAAVLNGADTGVLDTYDAERHPVGRMVLRTSGATIRLMTARPWLLRQARRHVMPLLLRISPLTQRIAGSLSGIDIHYGRTRDQHRLVGRRIPDLRLVDGSVFELLQQGGFVLVCRRTDPAVDADIRVGRRADDGPAVLIRPDGYVAWAGDVTDTVSGEMAGEDWRAALAWWTAASSHRPADPPVADSAR